MTAARTSIAPAARKARAPSARVLPVVTTSSTMRHRPPRTSAAVRRPTSMEDARLADLPSAPRPAWSATIRRWWSTSSGPRRRGPCVGTPARRWSACRVTRSSGRSPLRRTARGEDGTVTMRTGPPREPDPPGAPGARPRRASAIAAARSTARPRSRSLRPPSFQDRIPARSGPVYWPQAKQSGKAGGTGSGATRRRSGASRDLARAAEQRRHHASPGRLQAAHSRGSTRSRSSARRRTTRSADRAGRPRASVIPSPVECVAEPARPVDRRSSRDQPRPAASSRDQISGPARAGRCPPRSAASSDPPWPTPSCRRSRRSDPAGFRPS